MLSRNYPRPEIPYITVYGLHTVESLENYVLSLKHCHFNINKVWPKNGRT